MAKIDNEGGIEGALSWGISSKDIEDEKARELWEIIEKAQPAMEELEEYLWENVGKWQHD